MLRVLGIVALMTAAAATAQSPFKAPTSETSPTAPPQQLDLRRQKQEKADTRSPKILKALTSSERQVVFKALSPGATNFEIQMAKDICAKKCPECINGVECNLECVQKACVK